jgi:hypothetical protein
MLSTVMVVVCPLAVLVGMTLSVNEPLVSTAVPPLGVALVAVQVWFVFGLAEVKVKPKTPVPTGTQK